ncbi:MAG: hypothetical protein MRK00_00145 [Nitrosomonas sp.]|nr:hypothetical protein [Nitrosomonas sp.]
MAVLSRIRHRHSIRYSKVMADDVAADQIRRLYPAASTQFNLRHNANDPFGQALD